jgi:hypothetical protein
VEGDEITLKYKDGEKKIVVAPNTTIVTYVPGDKRANSSPAPKSSSPPPTRRRMARSKRPPSRSAATASRPRCEA